jgi:hypothetical protein
MTSSLETLHLPPTSVIEHSPPVHESGIEGLEDDMKFMKSGIAPHFSISQQLLGPYQ